MTLARLLIGLTHLSSIWMKDGQAGYEHKVDAGKLLTAADFPSHIPAPVRRVILRSINPDPAVRYATSLDMRRDLERLSYPGYWTVDASGDEIGHDTNCQYSISLQALGGDSFNLECSRTRSTSGRKQRVSEYCRKGVTRREAQKAIDAFKQMVVTGK